MRESVRAVVIENGSLLVMRRNKRGREYYTLIGGGIDRGETAEAALHREVAEEASITLASPRLIITQVGGPKFGRQYIYLCEYVEGVPALAANSEEALQNAEGENLYSPMWLPLEQLPQIDFLPRELQQSLLEYISKGFPSAPVTLMIPE